MFSATCDVLIAQNGDIFVADGHVADSPVGRIVKFSKDGKFIKAWGKPGSAPANSTRRTVSRLIRAVESSSADRGNSRIQIFDQDGRFLDDGSSSAGRAACSSTRTTPCTSPITQSNSKQNPGFKRGIRVGSAKDGKVTALIPFLEPDPEKNNNAGVEGVAADAKGNLYAAEVSTEEFKKYAKQ